MRYTVLIDVDPDGLAYVATVPTLPGCITQGDTVDQTLERIQEAIMGHVEALRATGQPVPVETEPPIVATVEVNIAA